MVYRDVVCIEIESELKKIFYSSQKERKADEFSEKRDRRTSQNPMSARFCNIHYTVKRN